MKLISVFVLACCAPFVFAQEESFKRECSVSDETVIVHVKKVPDLKQSCYEVSYENQKGYLCVWAGGTTPGREYGFTTNFNKEDVTEEGWFPRGGGNVGCTAERCFSQLCNRLVSDYRREQDRNRFSPMHASQQLDDFFKSNPTSQTR